jgi:hypothetical protein
LCRNRRELEEGFQQHVMMEEAAGDLATRFGKSLPAARQARTAARRAVGAMVDWTAGVRRAWQAVRNRE